MDFAIVASKKDIAGMNIAGLISKLPKYFTDKEVIDAENIDKEIKEDFLIFVSKHQGNTSKILSLHAPGNWKSADYGGKPGKVCSTSANVLKTFFQELNQNIPESWKATLECTHHGPYIEKLCLFIEVGSNKEDWKDKTAAKHIAETIEKAISKIKTEKQIAIGIGGPHYCPNFNKIQLNSNIAISHIIPEYSLPLTKEMLQEALEKTKEKVNLILLDWKGLGKSEEKQKTLEIIKDSGIKIMRTSEVEK